MLMMCFLAPIPPTCNSFVHDLHHKFALKDLGSLKFFLGIEFVHSSTGLHLNRSKYVGDLLVKAGLSQSKAVYSPMKSGGVLSKRDGTPLANMTVYRSLVIAL